MPANEPHKSWHVAGFRISRRLIAACLALVAFVLFHVVLGPTQAGSPREGLSRQLLRMVDAYGYMMRLFWGSSSEKAFLVMDDQGVGLIDRNQFSSNLDESTGEYILWGKSRYRGEPALALASVAAPRAATMREFQRALIAFDPRWGREIDTPLPFWDTLVRSGYLPGSQSYRESLKHALFAIKPHDETFPADALTNRANVQRLRVPLPQRSSANMLHRMIVHFPSARFEPELNAFTGPDGFDPFEWASSTREFSTALPPDTPLAGDQEYGAGWLFVVQQCSTDCDLTDCFRADTAVNHILGCLDVVVPLQADLPHRYESSRLYCGRVLVTGAVFDQLLLQYGIDRSPGGGAPSADLTGQTLAGLRLRLADLLLLLRSRESLRANDLLLIIPESLNFKPANREERLTLGLEGVPDPLFSHYHFQSSGTRVPAFASQARVSPEGLTSNP